MKIEKLKSHHLPNLSSRLINQKSSWAFVSKDGVVAVAGIVEMGWGSSGEIWFRIGPSIEAHKIEIARKANKFLRKEIKRLRYSCIWGHVYCDRLVEVKFAQVMGFVQLCRIPKMGRDGKDMFLYWMGAK